MSKCFTIIDVLMLTWVASSAGSLRGFVEFNDLLCGEKDRLSSFLTGGFSRFLKKYIYINKSGRF